MSLENSATIKHEIINIDKEVYFSEINKKKLKLQVYLFNLQRTIEDKYKIKC
ncbi:hypothetical protein [Clostridium felsineum]|uniref:hypothetical protein n=1 Tax=Clostridium felsineum TaxID=36839 RepID=UPI00203491BA|nr:hypothetical protein [Clostridium felsineum]